MKTLPIFWKKEHQDQLKKVSSFEELGEIGVSVIKTMPQPVYGISAPYTTGGFGLENNAKIIKSCIQELSLYEFNVFNFLPLDIGVLVLKEE